MHSFVEEPTGLQSGPNYKLRGRRARLEAGQPSGVRAEESIAEESFDIPSNLVNFTPRRNQRRSIILEFTRSLLHER
jgi:hypothetical protein